MVLEKSSSTTINARDTKSGPIFHALQACSIAPSAARRPSIVAAYSSSAGSGEFFMNIRSLGLGCAIALAIAVAGTTVRADDAIGQVKKASGMVRVVHQDGKTDPVKVGDHVRQSDLIKTDKASSVGITFLDNSMMSLGPSSELAL